MFFSKWKKIIFEQNQIIKTNIKDFFKFKKMEGMVYEDLLKSRDELKDKYDSEYEKLMTKKERLWQSMDLTKWEIDEYSNIDTSLLMKDKEYAMNVMCAEETKSIENIHKQFGYANNMNMEELKRMINNNSDKIVKMIKEFAEEFYPTLRDSISVWTSLNTYI